MGRGASENRPSLIGSGYFGKIPTHGDFVQCNLSRTFVDALDSWTRHSVRESQRALGRGWLDAFLVAPVWRGVAAADVVCPDAVAMVMMPSVDRVGRYFPLILAVSLTDHRGPLSNLPRQIEGWFVQAEALALSTLSPDFQRDAFDAELAALSAEHWYQPNLRSHETDSSRSLWWAENRPVAGFDDLPAPEEFHTVFLSAEASTEDKPNTATQETPQAIADTSQTSETPPQEQGSSHVLLDIECAASALKGTRSAVLTDAAAIGEDHQALSLISGIGSHPGLRGTVETVRSTLETIAEPFSLTDLIAEAKGKLGRANAMLCARGLHSGDVFATSCATLLVQGSRHAILWCGNVRCYLLRDGHLSLLTRDHIDPLLPQVITRAVGATRQLSLESQLGEAKPGDRYLLCSPGLISVTTETEIMRVLQDAPSAQQAADHLAQDAIIAGATLDVAALVVILNRKLKDGGQIGASSEEE
ncbi:type VI secretion system-associated protein TagF [Yoonia maritima]|uniref:type VI secretion system-associated protein TagF n=1 Tax=Yoonia maritima TaxID=1435347 RepID=UPI000D113E0F|nr:type VI secretion system-associated protein TagF [Yoonia maritima]